MGRDLHPVFAEFVEFDFVQGGVEGGMVWLQRVVVGEMGLLKVRVVEVGARLGLRRRVDLGCIRS